MQNGSKLGTMNLRIQEYLYHSEIQFHCSSSLTSITLLSFLAAQGFSSHASCVSPEFLSIPAHPDSPPILWTLLQSPSLIHAPPPLPFPPPASLIVQFCAEGYSCLQGYENVKTAHSIFSYVNSHFPPEQTHFLASDLPCCTSDLLLHTTWAQGCGGKTWIREWKASVFFIEKNFKISFFFFSNISYKE